MSRWFLPVLALLSAATPLVVDSALKGAALMSAALLGALLLSSASAAARHLVWLIGVLALLAVPLLSLVLPGWRVLPAWAVPPSMEASPLPEKDMSNGFHRTTLLRPAAREGAPLLADAPERFPGTPATAAIPAIPAAVPAVAAGPVFLPQPVLWWRTALPSVWSAGCAVLLLRLLGAHWLLRRAARRARAVSDGPLTAALAAAALRLGVTQRVRLLVEEKRTIPVVWGVWRPRLMLPVEALTWDAGQLQSVLLHELAHIRRRDTLVQWVTQLACAVHWFNPLVWLAAWRLHVERERACDDMVLASGVKASAYAEHLLHIASQLSPARWTSACGLAMARKSALEGRLLAVLSGKLNRRGVTAALAASSLILGAGVAIPVAMLRAAGPDNKADAASAASQTPPPMQNRTGKIQAATLAKLKWGEPVNGLRMALAFPPALKVPLLGEEEFYQLVVQNVSEKEIRYTADADAPNPRSMQWREGERIVQALSDRDAQKADWTLAPGECGVLWMFTNEERTKDGKTISSLLDNDLGGGTRYHVVVNMEVAKAPEGAWTGKLITGETRGSSDKADAPEPKHKDARALYEIWQRHARLSGDIPGALIGELAAAVKQFIKYNPSWRTVPKLNEILSRLDASHDWKAADAIALLDEVAGVQDSPLQTAAEKSTSATIRLGKALPEKFVDVAWGETQPNGLRAAWVLEPGAAGHRMGTALMARWLVQNTGKLPVMVRVPTWHQGDVSARDATGAEVEVSGIEWTTIPQLIPVRLAPGEFIEINTPGVGLGEDAGRGPWAGPRVGSNVLAKDATELTLTHGPLALDGSGVGMREDAPHIIGPGWWQAHIKAHLARELPLPASGSKRTHLLDRAVRELFATPPTADEIDAFATDQTDGAFDALVQRLAARADVVEFSGSLPTAPVKFRVLAADANADSTPRVVLGPGEYQLSETATIKIVGRPDGGRYINDTEIISKPSVEIGIPVPEKIEIPDGWGTWAIVCRPGEGFFYLLHKGDVRKIDYTNPRQIIGMPASDLPAEFRDEVKRQLDIAGVPVESQAEVFENPAPPGTTPGPKSAKVSAKTEGNLVKIPDDQYVKSSIQVGEVKDVVWNDPQNGLSLGYRITADEWRILGKQVTVELWVRNPGDKDVKFQLNMRPDIGLRMKLKDEKSTNHISGIVPTDVPPFGESRLLQPGQALKVKEFPVSLLRPRSDVSGVEGRYFRIYPGTYEFHCELDLPGFSATEEGGKQLTAAEGEWTGTLTTRALKVTIVAPGATALNSAEAGPRADVKPVSKMLFNEDYAAMAVQSEKDVNFVLFYQGHLSSGISEWSSGTKWRFNGTVYLVDAEKTAVAGKNVNKRAISVQYTSDEPEKLYLDGKAYDLAGPRHAAGEQAPRMPGRVFILRDVSEPIQTDRTLALRDQKDLAAIGDFVAQYRVVAEAPRTANAPGRYVLGDDVHLQITQTTVNPIRPGDFVPFLQDHAKIIFPDAKPEAARGPKPHEIALPNGSGTYGIVWERGGGTLWVQQKDLVRRYDFADAWKVQETRFGEGGITNIPMHLREAMKKAFDVSGAPVQKQMPEKRNGAAVPKLPMLPEDAYAKPGVHCQKFREEDAKRPGGELMGEVMEPSKPGDRDKEPLVLGVRAASDAQWRIGGAARVGLVVRNRSDGDVRFSYTGRLDNGISIVAVDEAGKEHGAAIAQFDGLLTFQEMLLPVAHVATIKQFTIRFDAEKRGVSEPSVAAFHLPPGKYTLRCKWNDAHSDVAHEGEWTGELVNDELAFTLASVPSGDAPKTSDAGPRRKVDWSKPPADSFFDGKYDPELLARFAGNPGTLNDDNNVWPLSEQILRAAVEGDPQFRHLLTDEKLAAADDDSRSLTMSLAAYDYSVFGNKAALKVILDQLEHGQHEAYLAAFPLGFVDEWDQSVAAVERVFAQRDGAKGEEYHRFWAHREWFFPESFAAFQKTQLAANKLDSASLQGVWKGSKEGVDVTLRFGKSQDWEVRFMEKDRKSALSTEPSYTATRLDLMAANEKGTPVHCGTLRRGSDGVLLLHVLEHGATRGDLGYRRVTDLVLTREADAPKGADAGQRRKVDDILQLAATTPKSQEEMERLTGMILEAAAEKVPGLGSLLKNEELKRSDDGQQSLALALAAYDYSLSGNKEALQFILDKVAAETTDDSDEVALGTLAWIDEWELSTAAYEKHSSRIYGAQVDAYGSFWEGRERLFPESYARYFAKELAAVGIDAASLRGIWKGSGEGINVEIRFGERNEWEITRNGKSISRAQLTTHSRTAEGDGIVEVHTLDETQSDAPYSYSWLKPRGTGKLRLHLYRQEASATPTVTEVDLTKQPGESGVPENPKTAAAKLTPDALLGTWRGTVNGEKLMLSFHRPPADKDVQLDIYFGEATIGALAGFTIAKDGGSVDVVQRSAGGGMKFGTMIPVEAGKLKLELYGRQKGQQETILTRDAEAAATEPQQEEARALFELWRRQADDVEDGAIPYWLVDGLADEVRAFVHAHPNLDSAAKLEALLPRFATSVYQSLPLADAMQLLNDVAYYSTKPMEAYLAREQRLEKLTGSWEGNVSGRAASLMIGRRSPVSNGICMELRFPTEGEFETLQYGAALDGIAFKLGLEQADGKPKPFGLLVPVTEESLKLTVLGKEEVFILTRKIEPQPTEPREQPARELFEIWKATDNADGTIPGAFIGNLATEVRAFGKAHAGRRHADNMVKLLPRFVTSRDWTQAEAIKLLDDVAYFATDPIAARLTKAKLVSGPLWRTMVEFQDIPVPIEEWSESLRGLRIGLRIVDADWSIGGKVRAELWLHNAGEKDEIIQTTGPDRQDAGVIVSAIGADGSEHAAHRGNWRILTQPMVCPLPAGSVVMAKTFEVKFFGPENDAAVWSAPEFHGLPEGKYKLRCAWSDSAGLYEGKEWRGSLTAPELEFTLVAGTAVDQPKVRPSGEWSAAWRELSATVAAARGTPEADVESLIAWGDTKDGLRSGVLMTDRVKSGGRTEARLVVRNVSEKSVTVALSPVPNRIDVEAAAADGTRLQVHKVVMLGVDPFFSYTFKPGEQLEFPAPPIQFGVERDADGKVRTPGFPISGVETGPGTVSVRFSMTNVHAPDSGVVKVVVEEAEKK